jgi:carbamoyl-phosphate synthase large subunit
MTMAAIMINCNPETVSTDFDTADKLYFEPVFWEHIYDIILHEQPEGVIVQLGGQTALKLAEKLHRYGIPVIGTSFEALDMAEDRERFSSLLRDLGIPYPAFGAVNNAEEAIALSRQLGFPLLVRLVWQPLGWPITGARGISPSGKAEPARRSRRYDEG